MDRGGDAADPGRSQPKPLKGPQAGLALGSSYAPAPAGTARRWSGECRRHISSAARLMAVLISGLRGGPVTWMCPPSSSHAGTSRSTRAPTTARIVRASSRPIGVYPPSANPAQVKSTIHPWAPGGLRDRKCGSDASCRRSTADNTVPARRGVGPRCPLGPSGADVPAQAHSLKGVNEHECSAWRVPSSDVGDFRDCRRALPASAGVLTCWDPRCRGLPFRGIAC